MTESILRANGIDLCHETFGSPADPTLLLIAGAGLQMTTWRTEFCQQLADRNRYVIRFDNRDSGRSTHTDPADAPGLLAILAAAAGVRSDGMYTLLDMARDTVALLDGLGIESAHVAGMSMGGMIGQTLALEFPERVRTLTAIMSAGRPTPLGVRADIRTRSLRHADTDEARIERAVDLVEMMNGGCTPVDRAELRAHAIEAGVRARGDDAVGSLLHIAAIGISGSRLKALRSLAIPALVIHGDCDPVIPVARGIELAGAIPGAKLRLIPKMGHRLHPAYWEEIVGELVALTVP